MTPIKAKKDRRTPVTHRVEENGVKLGRYLNEDAASGSEFVGTREFEDSDE